MSTEAPPPPPSVPTAQPAKKRSCLPGCLILFAVVIVIAGVGGYFGYNWVMDQVTERVTQFEEQGYEAQWGQMIEITDPVDKKMVYVAQMVKLHGDVSTDVAIIAQMAEVHGTIQGKLDFTGQQLTIKDTAVVEGNVELDFAQLVIVDGEVKGEVNGSAQQIINAQGETTEGVEP